VLALLAGGALSTVWVGSRIIAAPTGGPAVGTEQDAIRAQQTLFEIVRRSASRRPPAERSRREFTISEAELNAFLARHLGRVARLPLEGLAVSFLGDGTIDLRGRLALSEAFGAEGSTLVEYLPQSWRSSGVIVTLRGPLRIETQTSRGQLKALRFDVDEAYVGRQRVPVALLESLLGIREGLSRWSLPESIQAVIVEKGRAVLRTDS
jgi:hypothetical protein